MEMQTGNTNNHTSQIFFVLAAPMYWREWLVAPVLMVRYKGKCHVSSTNPNRQALTIHLAGSEKEKDLIPQDGAKIQRQTDIYHHGPKHIPNIYNNLLSI
jgi:hypothetical protein